VTARAHGARGSRGSSGARPLALASVIQRLERQHGAPPRPPTRDPWLAILRENAAYLVDDARREATFRALHERIGTTPAAILDARPGVLEQVIGGGGMQPERRAEKLRACARLAQAAGLDAVRAAAKGEPDEASARRLLKRFPGVGEPGADKLMLLAGAARTLALESNGLRVVVRLGLAPERPAYAATYRDAHGALLPQLPELPRGAGWLLEAHELLRRHGQQTCKRSAPLCGACALGDVCPSAQHRSA
jgi:endonuclease-3